MEIASSFSGNFSSSSLIIVLIVTVLCFPISLFVVRSKSAKRISFNKSCNCACSCKGSGDSGFSDSMAVTATATASASYMNGGSGGGGEMLGRAPVVVADWQTGASMMEQLVPEITTHALSYLDYPSLCRLSMTNSSMRKAANDDNAWKALYHKDFTMEQDNVTPVNGWKAYYAATRAIVNINADFFNIIRGRSLPEMGRLWLNADYVKCVHASGELFTGYNGVLESWQLEFNWEPGVDFQIRDVRARVLTNMAWVTMKAYVGIDHGTFHVTNVFEFHSEQWYMVHHHCSAMLTNGVVDHPMLG